MENNKPETPKGQSSQDTQHALSELTKSMAVAWAAVVFCVALTLYRYFVKGTAIQLLYVLLIGVLIVCAVSTTVKYVKVKRMQQGKR